MAHLLIHSLRQSLAPGCIPLFTSDGLNFYFYALTAHFGHWLQVGRRGRKVRQWQVGSKPDLRPGEEKLPTAEAGTRLARDASWNRGRSQSRLTGTGPLWKAQHRFY